MQSSAKLYILEVGHGICIILVDLFGITVFDCGYDGSVLIAALRHLKITRVDRVIISHADADHIGGLIDLLGMFPVGKVWLNADPSKKGVKWQDAVLALDSVVRFGTEVHVGLTSALSGTILSGEVEIGILGPSAALAAIGPGGTYPGGHVVDSNTLSAVIRLIHKGCPIALLPADMDEFALHHLLERQDNIEAKILVFPHHGGSCGGDDYAFAHKLCSAVKPELIVPSLHRSRYDNPCDEIMRGIRDASPNAHIMCTQLSRKCCPQLFATDLGHLTEMPSMGRANHACCGGSICVKLDGAASTYEPNLPHHQQFVKTLQTEAIRQGHAGPLCLR